MSDRKRALICLPAGIGEVIMSTPAMRTFYEQGYILHMMVRGSVITSHLLDDCPYVEQLIQTKTDCTKAAWETVHLPKIRSIEAHYDRVEISQLEGPQKARPIQIALELGVKPENYNLEVWINDEAKAEAEAFVAQRIPQGLSLIHI